MNRNCRQPLPMPQIAMMSSIHLQTHLYQQHRIIAASICAIFLSVARRRAQKYHHHRQRAQCQKATPTPSTSPTRTGRPPTPELPNSPQISQHRSLQTAMLLKMPSPPLKVSAYICLIHEAEAHRPTCHDNQQRPLYPAIRHQRTQHRRVSSSAASNPQRLSVRYVTSRTCSLICKYGSPAARRMPSDRV